MAKITIEKPGYAGKKKGGTFALVFIVLVLCAAFIAAYYHYAVPVTPVEDLQIESVGGEVLYQAASGGGWQQAEPGAAVKMGDKLKTGAEAEVNFGLPERLKIRLKPDSEFVYQGPGFFEKQPAMRLRLDQGVMFVATLKAFQKKPFEIITPHFKTHTRSGYFRVAVDKASGATHVGLMRGSAEVHKNELFNSKGLAIKGLETISAEKNKAANAPARVTREEWKQMNEVYDLILKSDENEAVQLDLSKSAGSFFDYVFDHGTFYTPKFGYCGREFFKDPDTGQVYMEMEYDVFPLGTFSGAYIKVRDADLKDFSALEFEMRRVDDEGYPESIRIELKSSSNTVRAFAAKLPKQQWHKMTFPLHVRTTTPLNEVTFVFMHDRVGEFKRGAVQLRNINLIKNPEPVVKEGLERFEDPADSEVKRYTLPSPGEYLFEEVKKIEAVNKKAVEEVVPAVRVAQKTAPSVKVVEVDNLVSGIAEPIVPPAQQPVKRPKISLKDLPLLEDLPTS